VDLFLFDKIIFWFFVGMCGVFGFWWVGLGSGDDDEFN
jgi:hypothetical protein